MVGTNDFFVLFSFHKHGMRYEQFRTSTRAGFAIVQTEILARWHDNGLTGRQVGGEIFLLTALSWNNHPRLRGSNDLIAQPLLLYQGGVRPLHRFR